MSGARTGFADPASIELLSLDVDGVLTDGGITYSASDELKSFTSRDGFGLRLWQRAGGRVAIVTGRGGDAVRRRAEELGITTLLERVSDKAEAVSKLTEQTGVAPERMTHVGDDWPDLALFRLVGYPVAVADAEPLVREHAAWVTPRAGGRGAVRDVVNHLLSARGVLDELATHWTGEAQSER
ncbi:MAG: HAD hydrolase family protein [Planctomycetota bacterium]